MAADTTGFGYVPATQGTLQPPPPDLPQESKRDQTYFSKRKAQRMARKEVQSTTIQIMRYVLLGCKATRQAMNTSQGWRGGGTAQPAVPAVPSAGSHVPMLVQHWAKATLQAAGCPGLLQKVTHKWLGHRAVGQGEGWRGHLRAARWGVSSPSAPGRH